MNITGGCTPWPIPGKSGKNPSLAAELFIALKFSIGTVDGYFTVASLAVRRSRAWADLVQRGYGQAARR